MKSVIQEGPTLSKAIELGWVKAGKPKEFTIKIFQEAKKNFFGLVKMPAKVGIFFKELTENKDLPRIEKRQQRPPQHHRQNQPQYRQQQKKKFYKDNRWDRGNQSRDYNRENKPPHIKETDNKNRIQESKKEDKE